MSVALPLGILGGSAFVDGPTPPESTPETVQARGETLTVHRGPGFLFLRRHGETYRPPHRVPHGAHAEALADLGVAATVGLCSVGALDPRLAPGTVVVPEDYLTLRPPPTLARDDEPLHIVPELSPQLRALLLGVARDAVGESHVVDGGVYAETGGPRFETRAEIRLLTDYATVVGMTGASEATVMQEAGLSYALLGIVDNYAHGVGEEPLTEEGFRTQLEANRSRARAILTGIIERTREGA